MATYDVPSLPAAGASRAPRQCPTSWPRSRIRPGTTVFELVVRPSPGGVTWAWARSDLDAATVVHARRELSALLDRPGDPGTLLVYLGLERFVDLRGMRLLVGTAARARARGGALAVVAPPAAYAGWSSSAGSRPSSYSSRPPAGRPGGR